METKHVKVQKQRIMIAARKLQYYSLSIGLALIASAAYQNFRIV